MASYTQELIDYFAQCITQHKQEEIARVLSMRTRHITLALENIYQPLNISAALRSAECFGIQDIHIIEEKYTFKTIEGIAKGASKWLDIKHHQGAPTTTTKNCLKSLKSQNYSIFATSPHPQKGKPHYKLHEVPIDQKIALVFGAELHGVSSTVLEEADAYVTIPMYGFTESFNISVSAALCLYDLTTRLRTSSVDWHLSNDEKDTIMLEWYKRIVKHPDPIEKRFLRTRNK